MAINDITIEKLDGLPLDASKFLFQDVPDTTADHERTPVSLQVDGMSLFNTTLPKGSYRITGSTSICFDVVASGKASVAYSSGQFTVLLDL